MKRIVVFVALALTMSACKIAVDVSATVQASGEGAFHVTFSFDKEFIQVVSTSPDGRRSLQALRNVGRETTSSGWILSSSSKNGGLVVTIDRPFSRPQDLTAALSQVANRPQKGSLAFLRIFRDFELTQSTSFSRTLSDVKGTVDLSPERLAPGFSSANARLRQALQQAASKVFSFQVSVSLPGRITHYSGAPTRLDGGNATWVAAFGSTLAFTAHSSYIRWSNIGYVIAPIALILLAAVLLLVLRARKRAAPVEGWEVPTTIKEESI
ncbi:MAG: hypothetical protein ACYDCC_13785 [Actinomycetota bacterium]